MTIEELKTTLAELSDAGGIDAKAFSTALHEAQPDFYNHVFRAGHANATERGNTKLEGVHGEMETLKAEIAKREERIKTLEQATPDLAKETAKYEAALQQKDQRLSDLTAKLADTEAGFVSKLRGQSVNMERERIIGRLTESGVDPDYARLKVSLPEFESRLKFRDDESIEAYQSDGVTPLSVPEGTTLSEALAREIMSGVPSKFIEDRRQKGSSLGKPGSSGNRLFRESEMQGWSDAEYEANRAELLQAVDEGRVISDID